VAVFGIKNGQNVMSKEARMRDEWIQANKC